MFVHHSHYMFGIAVILKGHLASVYGIKCVLSYRITTGQRWHLCSDLISA